MAMIMAAHLKANIGTIAELADQCSVCRTMRETNEWKQFTVTMMKPTTAVIDNSR